MDLLPVLEDMADGQVRLARRQLKRSSRNDSHSRTLCPAGPGETRAGFVVVKDALSGIEMGWRD